MKLVVEAATSTKDSPVSNNGRGLKHHAHQHPRERQQDSPVSNNGRGLKLSENTPRPFEMRIRPLAITGVD